MKRTNKTLEDLIAFAYFIGAAAKNHSNNKLFEASSKYDGNFEINPVIEKAVLNQVSGIELGDKPFYTSMKDVIHMPSKQHFPSAAEYHFVLLHEFGHAMSGLLMLSDAHMEYWRASRVATSDTDKLLKVFYADQTQATFKAFSQVEQDLLVAYIKTELQVDTIAAVILKEAGYKQLNLVMSDVKDTASLAHTISSFIGQDFTKEIYDESSKYAHETKALFNAISKEIEKAEKELGQSVKDFAPKEVSKGHDKER